MICTIFRRAGVINYVFIYWYWYFIILLWIAFYQLVLVLLYYLGWLVCSRYYGLSDIGFRSLKILLWRYCMEILHMEILLDILCVAVLLFGNIMILLTCSTAMFICYMFVYSFDDYGCFVYEYSKQIGLIYWYIGFLWSMDYLPVFLGVIIYYIQFIIC